MSKYIDSEKLIAEIEKRIEEYNIQSLRGAELADIRSFIISLQQEQPEVELDKKVQRWKNEHGVVGMDDLWLKFARHFYNLGFNAKNKV